MAAQTVATVFQPALYPPPQSGVSVCASSATRRLSCESMDISQK
jgi:hypothetical protein